MGRIGPGEGYYAAREITKVVRVTASNGRAGVKGQCAECGCGLCRLGGL